MYNYPIEVFCYVDPTSSSPSSSRTSCLYSVQQQKFLGPVSQTALNPSRVEARVTFPPGGQKVTAPNRSVFLTLHFRHHSPLTTCLLPRRSHVLTRTSPFLSITLDWLWPPQRSEDPWLSVAPLKCRTSPGCCSPNCQTSLTVHQNGLYQTGAKAGTPKTVNQTVKRPRGRLGSLLPPCRQRGLLMSWGWTIIRPLMTSETLGKVFTSCVLYKFFTREISVLTLKTFILFSLVRVHLAFFCSDR